MIWFPCITVFEDLSRIMISWYNMHNIEKTKTLVQTENKSIFLYLLLLDEAKQKKSVNPVIFLLQNLNFFLTFERQLFKRPEFMYF